MKYWLYLLVTMLYLSPAQAELVSGTDETAQLPFWEWRNDSVTLRFVQRLPDQTRAYFAGRGFKPAEVEHIAGHCIFQTVYTNITTDAAPHTIEHDIRNWRYHYNGKSYTMKPREDWKPLWQQRNVAQAQIVAFEWSLLPSQQIFQAGDYNWGMSVFKVPHGESFDLDIKWQVDGQPQAAKLKGMTCAKDEYIAPQ
jgi:hypothetical protein